MLSTAYFPPAEYFSLIAHASKVSIEKWENYHKQTYRNRCNILGANGMLSLTIPVSRGSFHKTAIRDLQIDPTRNWQDIHLRSIESGYATAPYFEYYFDIIKDVIQGRYKFLLDLNMASLHSIMKTSGLDAEVFLTDGFVPENADGDDYRYLIIPKKPGQVKNYHEQLYTQVFSDRFGFIPGLSIIDVLLNNGPGTKALLLRSLE